MHGRRRRASIASSRSARSQRGGGSKHSLHPAAHSAQERSPPSDSREAPSAQETGSGRKNKLTAKQKVILGSRRSLAHEQHPSKSDENAVLEETSFSAGRLDDTARFAILSSCPWNVGDIIIKCHTKLFKLKIQLWSAGT